MPYSFAMVCSQHRPDDRSVLSRAANNAARGLGLVRTDPGSIIGRDRARTRNGIDPSTRAGELALMLLRCYRSLFALVDGDEAQMRQWMASPNRGTGGVPREQVRSAQGFAIVLGYLDTMRGRR